MSALHHGRRALMAALLLFSSLGSASDTGNLVTAGRRLYREGLGHDGAPVNATVQGDVAASGRTLACVGCHKRSGLGSFEAGVRAVPVTAPLLFGPAATTQAEPARPRSFYTDESLVRAVTQGIAANGRALSPLMPRYRLDGDDSRALVAYLHELGSEQDPGVGPTELELVTIVAAEAPARDREAVTTVVRRFVDIKNGGSRQEPRRAEASRRHAYGEKGARSYREWNLSVWNLEGPPASWLAQLEELYRTRPPFVVVSGAVGSEWSVVHAFCESHELPCILPVTELPVESGPGYYTLYYSAGVRLEARVTARSIAADAANLDAKILVAYFDDARGRAALDAFSAALPGRIRANLTAKAMTQEPAQASPDWKDVIARERPDVLVAWLSPDQLQTLASIPESAATLPRRIYTASAFNDWHDIHASPVFEQRVYHVEPHRLEEPGRAQFPREEYWLRQQGFGGLEKIPAAEALFACHAVGEAMAAMADNYSRDYLIEMLEHMLDGTAMTTVYPLTTLGTGQRFLAKGAYVLRLAPGTGASRYSSSGWVQP